MAIAEKIKKYLCEKHIGYQILQHSLAYTAMETAGAQHVPGKQLIKSVIVKADNKYIMCVLSSNHMVNFNKLKKITNATEIYLANETEIESLFPEIDIGAEPPFGELFGLDVFVDRAVAENDEIVFNAGTHTDAIKIKYEDFAKLTKSKLVSFTEPIKG